MPTAVLIVNFRTYPDLSRCLDSLSPYVQADDEIAVVDYESDPSALREAVARHGGVSGLSRISHDLLLRLYLDTDESHELGEAFRGKRTPDPDKFGH